MQEFFTTMPVPSENSAEIGTNAELMDAVDAYMKGDTITLCADFGPLVLRENNKVEKTLIENFDMGVRFDYLRGCDVGPSWINAMFGQRRKFGGVNYLDLSGPVSYTHLRAHETLS
jgi:hypothetical protein